MMGYASFASATLAQTKKKGRDVPLAYKTPLRATNNAVGEIPFTSKIPPSRSNDAKRMEGQLSM